MMPKRLRSVHVACGVTRQTSLSPSLERLAWYACVLVLIPGLLSSMAAAADVETQVREIAQQLRCPVCQGLSVGDSPSELANEMRDVVREQLRQGKTPEEVLDYFVQRYGEWILLAPPKRGFNLVIWVLPFLLLPVGALVVYTRTRRWVRNRRVSVSPSPAVDAKYSERLQHEIDSYP